MVQFYRGKSHKKEYRYFTIKSLEKGKIDDYHSLKEASARRYSRLLNENLPFPDLILIDGGKGQLHAVEAILKALEIDIPLIALAEKNEEITYKIKTNPTPPQTPARLLLQRIATKHRFAQRKVHASQNDNYEANKVFLREETILRFSNIRVRNFDSFGIRNCHVSPCDIHVAY